MSVFPYFRNGVCGECNEPLEWGSDYGYSLDDRSHIVLICASCDDQPKKSRQRIKQQLSHVERLQAALESIKPHYEQLIAEDKARKARIRRTSTPRDLRWSVILRDDYACRYCGKRLDDGTVTIDHILPVSRGGKHEATNLVAACRPCNYRKKTQTPDEAGMVLLPLPQAEISGKF